MLTDDERHRRNLKFNLFCSQSQYINFTKDTWNFRKKTFEWLMYRIIQNYTEQCIMLSLTAVHEQWFRGHFTGFNRQERSTIIKKMEDILWIGKYLTKTWFIKTWEHTSAVETQAVWFQLLLFLIEALSMYTRVFIITKVLLFFLLSKGKLGLSCWKQTFWKTPL